ncbi:MAG: aminotransferase class III-fold pyridoxal phosphate-dependent enzyme [Actinomycetota bacterium]|nr:aminotransferase class III-fold pyridoxal phosphate-dependent enzyme [Actinomycetota bacterium]
MLRPGVRAVSVLEAPPPRFAPDEIAAIAAELFGVEGMAVDLGSERDQTFLIDDGHGGGGVLKISNLGEDPAVLDFETETILHVCRVDPELPVARPRLARHGRGGGGPVACRPIVEGPDGVHFVRLFDRVRGHVGGSELDDGALRDFAATHARLNLALRSFFHPAASRELLWDLKHAPRLRPLLGAIRDAERRRLVAEVIDRYEERVQPQWLLLRAQVVHGDYSLDNVLLDERDRIAGIVDFGDLGHTAQVADFAIGLASLLRGRRDEDVFRAARIAIDGYAGRIPFEPLELEVLADLVAARLAAIVSISAWRVERYPENAEYIQAWDEDSWKLLEFFASTGADEVAYELGRSRPPVATPALARRRRRVLGSALTDLTYEHPVHVGRGDGVWLFEANGRRLLDAYNNVPVVGHCHPRVTEAVVRQTRMLNTHSRYLYEPLIELAERLAASMPKGSGLNTVMLVNSGSEANELAWRLATTTTGRSGAIVTEHAYHGVTTAISELSPEEWPEGHRGRTTELVAPPTPASPGEGQVARAIARLDERRVGLAATFVDCAFTSDGIQTPPPQDLMAMVRHTQAAGGLFVADEVQAGHGRSGEELWMFASYGIAPDVVTLGKPMGNGYPVAAVVARREVVDDFAARTRLFSTFGGNPVASCAALAVLDVIEDERLVGNAGRVGSRLRHGLEGLRAHPSIADVRGRGLLIGVELSDPASAERVANRLRDDGILIGRTGRGGNVLKIRPPLVFRDEHADAVVEGLSRALNADETPALREAGQSR